MERKRKRFEEEKESFAQERNNLVKIKQQVSDERLRLFEEKKDTHGTQGTKSTSLDMKVMINERPCDKDLQNLYDKLRAQIGVFNREISDRESKIHDQQRRLGYEQEQLSKNLYNLQGVKEGLLRTKQEILTFYNETIPQLEAMYRAMLELLAKMKTGYADAESLYNRMSHSMSLASSLNGSRSQLEIRPNSSSVESRKSENGIDLNSKGQNHRQTAEMLKEAKVKIETSQKEIAEEKEKLKIQHQQLEQGVRALNAKKIEIMQYKLELDKRANLLNMKESQLDLKDLRKSQV